jgi:hypothetical protein
MFYGFGLSISDRCITVISEIRSKDTDPQAYARKVGGWVLTLLKNGVPTGHISVVGGSKGGDIAARVSSLLQQPDLSYVILARLFAGQDPFTLTGRVLSIHDSSDKFAISPEIFNLEFSRRD